MHTFGSSALLQGVKTGFGFTAGIYSIARRQLAERERRVGR
jgi:hypothetical protein